MSLLLVLSIVAMSSAGLVGVTEAQTQQVDITGSVQDAANQSGIANADITVIDTRNNSEVTSVTNATDDTGNFTLTGVALEDGVTYTVEANHTEYEASVTSRSPITTNDTDQSGVIDAGTATLSPLSGSISGSVNEVIHRNRTPPYVVTANLYAGHGVNVEQTDPDKQVTVDGSGNYSFDTVTPGNYTVQVTGIAYTNAYKNTVFVNETREIIVGPGDVVTDVNFAPDPVVSAPLVQAMGTDAEGNDVIRIADLDSNENVTVLVASRGTTNDLRMAGKESVGKSDDATVHVPIGNTSGFPGRYAVFVVPDEDINGEYTAGDEFTRRPVKRNATAYIAINIIDAEVAISDRAEANQSINEVTVDTASLYHGLNTDSLNFSVVIWDVGEDPKQEIGRESGLYGTNHNVTVAVDEITSDTQIRATLEVNSSQDPRVDGWVIRAVQRDNSETPGWGPVQDAGQVTVGQALASVEQVTINKDFIGTVDDPATATVTASGFKTADGSPLKNGTVTITIANTTYENRTFSNGKLATTIDPTEIPAATETGVVDVAIDAEASATDQVQLVHEVEDLDEGFNLVSIPQPATLHETNISAVNKWVTSEETYASGLTDGQAKSAENLHRGFYVDANSDDARLGYEFETDKAPTPGEVKLEQGWHLASSNYAIDEAEGGSVDEPTLNDDLKNLPAVSEPGISVVDANQQTSLDGDTHNVSAFETYWVYIDDPARNHRAVITPNYNPEDRADLLAAE